MPAKPTNQTAQPARTQSPESVTGVQLAQGIGHRPVQGFWGEAWSQVIRRPGAIFGLTWIAIVAFFAVFAPFLASGHPLVMREGGELTSPLLDNLKSTDILLCLGAVAGVIWMALPLRIDRGTRLGVLLLACLQAGIVVILISFVAASASSRDASDWLRAAEQGPVFVPLVCGGVSAP